jgi:hypothetical protein
MRFHFLLVVVCLCMVVLTKSNAQTQFTPKSGHIGIGLGPSTIVGDNGLYKGSGTGLNLTLVNAGYTFYKGFGVSINWAGAAFIYDAEFKHRDPIGHPHSDNFQHEISIGTLMIGPMYTLNLSQTSRLDFNARAGRLYLQDKRSSDMATLISENTTTSWSVGTTYQKRIGQWLALTLSADYHRGNSKVLSENSAFGLINLTGGIAVLL